MKKTLTLLTALGVITFTGCTTIGQQITNTNGVINIVSKDAVSKPVSKPTPQPLKTCKPTICKPSSKKVVPVNYLPVVVTTKSTPTEDYTLIYESKRVISSSLVLH